MSSFCVLGDSVAKGIVLDKVTEKYITTKNSAVELFKDMTGSPVKNLSHFGSTIVRATKLFYRHEKEMKPSDQVILEFGSNDCDFQWAEIAEHPDEIHLPNVPLAQFTSKYCALIDIMREKGLNPILTNLSPIHAEKFFQWVSRGLDKDAILHWLKDIQQIYRWQERYSIAVHEIAIIKRVPLINIRKSFLEPHDLDSYLCEDGMHPNEKGHQLIAEALCNSYNNPEIMMQT
jgi:acyl-CoA thioesterase-1